MAARPLALVISRVDAGAESEEGFQRSGTAYAPDKPWVGALAIRPAPGLGTGKIAGPHRGPGLVQRQHRSG